MIRRLHWHEPECVPGDVPILLVSHLHPDHVSGLPDFVWGEMTGHRRAPLTVIGPPAGDGFLDISTFVDRLLSKDGAFPDLAGVVSGEDFPVVVEVAAGDGSAVMMFEDLVVQSFTVGHGRAPTLAFRIETEERVVVFAGDQTLRDPAFAAFARSADLLVLHGIVNRQAEGHPLSAVVALPMELGRVAADAAVGAALVSHLMGAPPGTPDADLWSLANLDLVLADVRSEFSGEIVLGSDLLCVPVRRDAPG